MKIRHEHIRKALSAWEFLQIEVVHPDGTVSVSQLGKKGVVMAIVKSCSDLGLTGLGLYGGETARDLLNNRQKIYRWVESDSLASQRKIQALLPAIEKAMPVFLLARMRSHSSATCRDLVMRKERIDREMEAMIGAIIALSDRVDGSGPAGNALIH